MTLDWKNAWADHILYTIRQSLAYKQALRYGVKEQEFIKSTLKRDGAPPWLVELVMRKFQ